MMYPSGSRRSYRLDSHIFGMFLVALSFICATVANGMIPTSPEHPQSDGAILLSNTVVGYPIATPSYLFWMDSRDSQHALYGYNLNTQQEFLIKHVDSPYDVYSLASDGQTLAWVDTARPIQRVQGYDLNTRQEFTIVTDVEPYGLGSIALDQGVLYYQDGAASHQGIYAYNLTTSTEQQVSMSGSQPVVRDGVLLWNESHYHGEYLPAEWNLYQSTLDDSQDDIIIASGNGALSNYAVSGDRVVWSSISGTGDDSVQSYALSTKTQTTLSSTAGHTPIIAGDVVAWIETQMIGTTITHDLVIYNYRTGVSTALVEASTAQIGAIAFVDENTIVFTVATNPMAGVNELYLTSSQQQGLQFAESPSDGSTAASGDQISVCGSFLCDGGQRWRPKGVQFFLPQFGINNFTFVDSNYNNTSQERLFWLDKASDELFVRTLRIYVAISGEAGHNTYGDVSPSTIVGFATQAHQRGMRVGLVLHNSGSFYSGEGSSGINPGGVLTDDQRQWVRELLDLFESTTIDGKPATSLIAYINVDNEINNHCRDFRDDPNKSVDCYLRGTPPDEFFDSNLYVQDSINWVRNFTSYIRDELNSPVLLTVGMSTELGRLAGTESGAVNYFRAAPNGDRLIDFVDFISPHNYGGGGRQIMSEVRERFYNDPVVLEEYGFPTDPAPNSPVSQISGQRFFSEGDAEDDCGNAPLSNDCVETAPWFTQRNIDFIQQDGYAGGVAFMLVDMNARRCDGASDLYTGLFSPGNADYCGGTLNLGGIKSTGLVVQRFYSLELSQVYLPLIRR